MAKATKKSVVKVKVCTENDRIAGKQCWICQGEIKPGHSIYEFRDNVWCHIGCQYNGAEMDEKPFRHNGHSPNKAAKEYHGPTSRDDI